MCCLSGAVKTHVFSPAIICHIAKSAENWAFSQESVQYDMSGTFFRAVFLDVVESTPYAVKTCSLNERVFGRYTAYTLEKKIFGNKVNSISTKQSYISEIKKHPNTVHINDFPQQKICRFCCGPKCFFPKSTYWLGMLTCFLHLSCSFLTTYELRPMMDGSLSVVECSYLDRNLPSTISKLSGLRRGCLRLIIDWEGRNMDVVFQLVQRKSPRIKLD